jgi:hypothetical protein
MAQRTRRRVQRDHERLRRRARHRPAAAAARQDPAQDWRWSEQWLLYGIWLVLVLAV